jgi:hypothetical protein
MVTKSRLWERRQNLLGVVYTLSGDPVRVRLSSFDADTVRFVTAQRGVRLANATLSWSDFARMLRAGAMVEA